MGDAGGTCGAAAAPRMPLIRFDVDVNVNRAKARMNPQEAELQYALGDTLPESGRTIEVAPGVRWIRMALPFALDHITLWLLRDTLDGREGWTAVDCCITRDEAKAQWEQVFASSLEGLPILRVIVTHMHPDHIGLAHWLCERWSPPSYPCRLCIS